MNLKVRIRLLCVRINPDHDENQIFLISWIQAFQRAITRLDPMTLTFFVWRHSTLLSSASVDYGIFSHLSVSGSEKNDELLEIPTSFVKGTANPC